LYFSIISFAKILIFSDTNKKKKGILYQNGIKADERGYFFMFFGRFWIFFARKIWQRN